MSTFTQSQINQSQKLKKLSLDVKPAWPDGHSKSFCSNLKYDSQKSNQTDLKFGLWKYETAKLIMNQLKHLIKTVNLTK